MSLSASAEEFQKAVLLEKCNPLSCCFGIEGLGREETLDQVGDSSLEHIP